MQAQFLGQAEQVIRAGPYAADWDSLAHRPTPAWYQNGKFGIFIHWGVYAVPAFGSEWYPRNMYQAGTREYAHHLATYGAHHEFGYKDFIPQFKAEHFDPQAWAELFRRSGARYVVPVAEHHDGFQMYASALSRWNAAQMGPRRDLIGELAEAVRAEGLVFGLSSHRAEHFFFFDGGLKCLSDVTDPEFADFYGPPHPAPQDLASLDASPPTQAHLENWLARSCELVDRFQPQLVYFDWWIQNLAFKPYLQRFAAYYYNRAQSWNKEVAINHKFRAFELGSAVYDVERGQLDDIAPFFWQGDTSVSKNSWGYIRDHDYKTANDLISDLVDTVSKNGALLLNIGPRPDGTIPEPEQELLLAIGQWLATNGEAIYETRPWQVYGEGPTQVAAGPFSDTKRAAFSSEDIRFTRKGGNLYAMVLKWPENGRLFIKSLAGLGQGISGVALLGSEVAPTWQLGENGLAVDLAGCAPSSTPVTLRILGQG